MRPHNILSCIRKSKNLYFASCSGTMINTHWLELPLSRTYLHSPKSVRAIEVRLYILLYKKVFNISVFEISRVDFIFQCLRYRELTLYFSV